MKRENISIPILTRTIKFDKNGKIISDSIIEHISGKIYQTPSKKVNKK